MATAGLSAETVLPTSGGELGADVVGPRVLPHDRVGHGLAGHPVPQNGGLALVGDPHGGEVGRGEPGLGERRLDDFYSVDPDL